MPVALLIKADPEWLIIAESFFPLSCSLSPIFSANKDISHGRIGPIHPTTFHRVFAAATSLRGKQQEGQRVNIIIPKFALLLPGARTTCGHFDDDPRAFFFLSPPLYLGNCVTEREHFTRLFAPWIYIICTRSRGSKTNILSSANNQTEFSECISETRTRGSISFNWMLMDVVERLCFRRRIGFSVCYCTVNARVAVSRLVLINTMGFVVGVAGEGVYIGCSSRLK